MLSFIPPTFTNRHASFSPTGDRREEDGVGQAGSVREEGEEGERGRQEGPPEEGGRGDHVGQDVLAGRLVRTSVRRNTRLQIPQTGECFRKIKLLIFYL